MEEITIVKRRSRVWPIVLTLLMLALIALAVVWWMGGGAEQLAEDIALAAPAEAGAYDGKTG